MTEPDGFRFRTEDADLREEIDEGVKRWHDRAVAAGQERVLARTKDGDLYSYHWDEITFGGKYVPIVESVWSMTIFAGVMAAMTLTALVVYVPFSASDGQWGRLLVPAGFGLFDWLLVFWARQDWAARARREERGVPEPKTGKRPVQIDFGWPPPRMRGRGDASRL
ncbi:hypothetical protein AB4Y77_17900 [Paenarthrobacter sp. YAF11_1]|uniref:hypothetical protein n=1 Tax=Paenarthrobacter sp. YAF11_1 TaxID=3233074 RepID=UPI003F997D5D